jgi:Ca2+/Na+ antiporter
MYADDGTMSRKKTETSLTAIVCCFVLFLFKLYRVQFHLKTDKDKKEKKHDTQTRLKAREIRQAVET